MPGNIIWLGSYMKSGNTWLRLLLANLLSNEAKPVDINDFDLSPRSATRRDDLEELTLVDTSLLSRAELDTLRPRAVEAISAQTEGLVFLKLHDAYRRGEDGEPLLGQGHSRAALYMLRDPRDVVVSLSHHCGIMLDEAINRMNRSSSWNPARYTMHVPQMPLDWSSNVESWVDQQDVPVIVIRYEDMLADTIGTLGRITDFLGLDLAPGRVEHAVRCADFRALQQQERDAGFRERIPVRGTPAPFFRSGRAGAWREILTTAQEEAIVAAHQRVMQRFGYL
ncbi:MAG TPA: sulfotransferase domain-containing protein [Burkholderiales bacterium]|nr:sulfotransferase domain-containing protein [Burkholderiales bacterium]